MPARFIYNTFISTMLCQQQHSAVLQQSSCPMLLLSTHHVGAFLFFSSDEYLMSRCCPFPAPMISIYCFTGTTTAAPWMISMFFCLMHTAVRCMGGSVSRCVPLIQFIPRFFLGAHNTSCTKKAAAIPTGYCWCCWCCCLCCTLNNGRSSYLLLRINGSV